MTIIEQPCAAPIAVGSMSIVADDLAEVDLSCSPDGYVVSSFQIGFPAVREVVRNRALADGRIDDTTFVGGRAVTLTITLDNRRFSTQAMLDRLLPFMSPRRRPVLTWSLPGSPADLRSLTVRGVDAPVAIAGARFTTLVVSFVSSDAFTFGDEVCQTIIPSQAVEVGRTYNLTFNRVYAATLPSGSFIVTNAGNAVTDWTGVIVAEIADPVIEINGVEIRMDANGGVTLLPGQTLVIDTEARSILLNGDPTEPRYAQSNFAEWAWDDVRLQPGDNLVRLTGATIGATASLTVCHRPRWW